jgi:hypothetical protein
VVAADKQGKFFAVLFQDEELWAFDSKAENAKWRKLDNDVSAIEFVDDGLLVADRATRVTRRDLTDLQEVESFQPADGFWMTAYYYVINPFYTIFPKPGELDTLVQYLLTEEDSALPSAFSEVDPRQSQIKIDIYGPLWSNLAFVVVMLGISCFMLSRADL